MFAVPKCATVDTFRDSAERELWAASYSAERKRGASYAEATRHADDALRAFRERT